MINVKSYIVLSATALGLACGAADPGVSDGALSLDRTVWLGSPDGWGVLGLPGEGGALAYRGARNLEAPTWSPAELEPVARAEAVPGAIWLQFRDGGLALFDYSTGRLRSHGVAEGRAVLGLALTEQTAIVVGPDSTSLATVGEPPSWRFNLPGRLHRLTAAGDGRLVATVRTPDGAELLVLRPPEREPVGQREIEALGPLIVTAWGRRIYYATDDSVPVLRGLSLPELRPVGDLGTGAPTLALAATPSGHRIYAATIDRLHVFDRLSGDRLREIELPEPVSTLRFGTTGSSLLARVAGADRIVVFRVGVDSVLGVVGSEWDEFAPVLLPGGRVVTRIAGELVLYDLPALNQIARVEERQHRLWLPVEWQPPRPRKDLVRRVPAPDRLRAQATSSDDSITAGPVASPNEPVRAGYYAVVLAARALAGVDSLVGWLRGVGYPATLERHRDPMGVVWYRAMVGSYPSRARAEAAARELGARYGFKPWILTVEESDADDPPDAPEPGDPSASDESDRPGDDAGVDAAGEAGETDSDD